jgi:hypothetical protein
LVPPFKCPTSIVRNLPDWLGQRKSALLIFTAAPFKACTTEKQAMTSKSIRRATADDVPILTQIRNDAHAKKVAYRDYSSPLLLLKLAQRRNRR